MNKIKKFQRDEVIKIIYKAAQKNKKIFFLSAGFGAPALDDFRSKLKNMKLYFGKGGASKKILNIIRKYSKNKHKLLNKQFQN